MKALDSIKVNNIEDISKLMSVCQVLADAPFYQKLGPSGVLAIALTASEMGLPLMASLNGGMHNIEGRVTLSAQFLGMMILKAGHRFKPIEMTSKKCVIRFTRKDALPGEQPDIYEYTIEDAMIAGYLGKTDANGNITKKAKDNWVSNPRDMLFNRCLSGGYKKFMPDVGIFYAHGELLDDETIIQYEEVLPEVKTEIVAPKPLLLEKTSVEFQDFLKKHDIKEGSDSDKYLDYVLANSPNKMSKDELVAKCIIKEESFKKSMDIWISKLPKEEEITLDSQDSE